MRLIIFLGLLVTLLLSGCGSDSAATTDSATPNTGKPAATENTSDSEEESKLVNAYRLEVITAVNRAQTAALMSEAALPNATNDKLIKIEAAYTEYRAKIEKYEAKTVAELKKFVAAEAKALAAALIK